MAIVSWPAELPSHMLRDGFAVDYPDARAVPAVDAMFGAGRNRRTREVMPVTAAFRFTAAQRARFWRFWKEDLDGGRKAFKVVDQINDGASVLTSGGLPLQTSDGTPIVATAYWRCRFADRPREASFGKQWRVDVSLLVLT